jgi:hypothetical protein
MEMIPIRFKRFPCCPIAVCHGLELHETWVCLLFARTLPSVGRVADVERIVVALSSGHEICFYHGLNIIEN